MRFWFRIRRHKPVTPPPAYAPLRVVEAENAKWNRRAEQKIRELEADR